MCYYIKGLCAASQRDYNLSFTFFNKTREILDRNPKIKYELGQRYVMTMSHLLRCYIEVHDFENAQSVIDEMRELEGKKGFNSVDITLKIFTRSFILELMLLHVMGDFRKCIQLIPVIERKELQFGEMVSKEQTLLFNYYKAYSFFGVGDYKKALYYLNIVLNDTEQKLRQDIYSYARLFNLILHYELGNYDFLEYLLKSTNRYFVKKEFSVSSEIIFIKHMGKLSKAVNNNERLLIFEFMKDELEEILSNHDERVVLQYFDILAWITCKTYKITFSEAVRSRLEL
jgi:tetratricopeptide (TPR) repeat protein